LRALSSDLTLLMPLRALPTDEILRTLGRLSFS
jgi:hypothetical protein